MYVSWKKVRKSYYAYLRESIWDKEKKSPRAAAVYLGAPLEEAERKLRAYLSSGQVAVPGDVQWRLIRQLRETAPERAKEPKRDIPLESTIRLLQRQREKYQDRPDIVKALDAALKALEGGMRHG